MIYQFRDHGAASCEFKIELHRVLWRQLFYTTTHQQHLQQRNSRRGEASCLARPSEGGWLPPPSIPTQIQHSTPSHILRTSHGWVFVRSLLVLFSYRPTFCGIGPQIIINGSPLSNEKGHLQSVNIALAFLFSSDDPLHTEHARDTNTCEIQHHGVLGTVIYGFH